MDQLRKELEEKFSKLEELSRIWRELEKKGSDLKLAQERLKKADSALQRARVEEEVAHKSLKNCSLRWMNRGLLPGIRTGFRVKQSGRLNG